MLFHSVLVLGMYLIVFGWMVGRTVGCEGILTSGGLAMEGPAFRNLSPAQLDTCIHRLQVSSK